MAHSPFALLSMICSLLGFVPFAVGIYRKTLKPHIFTWLIWVVVTAIIFFAQLRGGGGAGAWATAVITLFCMVGFIVSLFRGEPTRTRFDWICLGLAFAAIGLWLVNGTPHFSVILLTLIEALAFGPTVRKSLINPYTESVLYYVLCVLKYLFAALALEHFTFDTALYPVCTCGMAIAFVIFLLLGRAKRPKPTF